MTYPSFLAVAMALAAASSPALVSAATSDCFALSGSTACPAWSAASISLGDSLAETYSFMSYVTDLTSFDREIGNYVNTSWIKEKYQNQFGCNAVNYRNATEYYARWTKSTICSALVQMSASECGVTTSNSMPLCATSCAQFASSEAYVTEDNSLCGNSSSNAMSLIKADFNLCASSDETLSSTCISGSSNEPTNCGFGDSTIGLCSYCATGGTNSTDTCCYSANAGDICANVTLPSITSTMTFSLPTATSTSGSSPSAEASNNKSDDGLSGGAIAGIVIGSIAGALLLLGLVWLVRAFLRRRHRGSSNGSVFNQPSPARKGTSSIPPMSQHGAKSSLSAPPTAVTPPPQGYEVLPGGRIARMSALEGHANVPSTTSGNAGITPTSRRHHINDRSSSDGFGESPEPRAAILRPPPAAVRRNASLSSSSLLNTDEPLSPTSAGDMSSAPGVNSQQSEQLPFFKDYYSHEDIHPGDRVAVLWAYQPRAPDEFTLERGDMVKVVGIWDDGWATGIMMDERAEEWEARRQAQRDSGVSSASATVGRDVTPPVSGEIKAFPLVCVCMPDHWRKTVEGDISTEGGASSGSGLCAGGMFQTQQPLQQQQEPRP
ncbi:hypothetical protein Cpir12675_003597 [Ceratocystis pirilliformis]|uniref:SH3 domain-containing protein n=1 Tax=Ceratocystis pirilliformis TaxID=259994 RepID=A0ABR3Z1X4_9PEZI